MQPVTFAFEMATGVLAAAMVLVVIVYCLDTKFGSMDTGIDYRWVPHALCVIPIAVCATYLCSVIEKDTA